MKLWVPGKSKIDRDKCRCSCFDTIMRGKPFDYFCLKLGTFYVNKTPHLSYTFSCCCLEHICKIILIYIKIIYYMCLVCVHICIPTCVQMNSMHFGIALR